jgi:hypothetical protein
METFTFNSSLTWYLTCDSAWAKIFTGIRIEVKITRIRIEQTLFFIMVLLFYYIKMLHNILAQIATAAPVIFYKQEFLLKVYG